MKIEKRKGSESEKNENKINIKRDATDNDDDEIMRNDHYFKNLYQN